MIHVKFLKLKVGLLDKIRAVVSSQMGFLLLVVSCEGKEWTPFLKKKLDRINRNVRIRRPSAERPLAAGEKIPDNPVNPV